ncbi:MAG: putative oxidoreductase [Thermoleophilaceae bacterium]|jgi:putative oxidoreductase|nr:putative oxidoreductase [Thermoleophilaceae bacterium]
MDTGLLVLRVIVGLLFAGHGAQKLFGVFGGHGLAGTGGFFESLGLRPGKLHAFNAGAAEFFGGALLALGLLTPLAAVLLIGTMTVAIATVHGSKGPWSSDGGYEYNLVLMAVAFAVAGVGAGDWSLDSAFGLSLSGTAWALGALAVGVAGGLGTVGIARLYGRSSAGTGAHATPA